MICKNDPEVNAVNDPLGGINNAMPPAAFVEPWPIWFPDSSVMIPVTTAEPTDFTRAKLLVMFFQTVPVATTLPYLTAVRSHQGTRG